MQVEHRPPKQSLHGEGRGWSCDMVFTVDFSLKLTHLKIDWSNCVMLLEFDDGDTYSWTFVRPPSVRAELFMINPRGG